VKLSQLMAEADGAFDGRDFASALTAYRAALEAARADRDKARDIRAQITVCEFELLLRAAAALGGQRKYAEASLELEKARQKLPDRADEADELLDEMQRRRKYEEHIDSAKASLAKKDFTRALDALKRAQELNVGEEREVQDLSAQVQYERFVALGNTAMDQARYPEARAYFRQAQFHNDNDEIQRLIRLAEEKIK
jgi:tetratricopeptide (TPR) repeat protein